MRTAVSMDVVQCCGKGGIVSSVNLLSPAQWLQPCAELLRGFLLSGHLLQLGGLVQGKEKKRNISFSRKEPGRYKLPRGRSSQNRGKRKNVTARRATTKREEEKENKIPSL
jgi:hypothetical protein